MKVYYTYGSDEKFPFYGGWVEVEANSMKECHALYRAYYPDRTDGILNCADYYTEDEFISTGMIETGNRGSFCHRKIKKINMKYTEALRKLFEPDIVSVRFDRKNDTFDVITTNSVHVCFGDEFRKQ